MQMSSITLLVEADKEEVEVEIVEVVEEEEEEEEPYHNIASVFEKAVMDDMSSFGEAGNEILRNERKDWDLCKPMKTALVAEKMRDPETGVITVESRA